MHSDQLDAEVRGVMTPLAPLPVFQEYHGHCSSLQRQRSPSSPLTPCTVLVRSCLAMACFHFLRIEQHQADSVQVPAQVQRAGNSDRGRETPSKVLLPSWKRKKELRYGGCSANKFAPTTVLSCRSIAISISELP